ncbi:MAG: thiamine phosphate synthase [Planctomycetales bacterium]|nr:thiamine phosphate synthase [Planctomycetales bacterium]
MHDESVWRILDANANRGIEGLRVVEEYVRFVLDDAHLTSLYKHLRHDLVRVLAELPETMRLASRDTAQDVGTSIATAAEYERLDLAHVVAANQKRVEQSLRSLEEFAKLIDPNVAREFEALRYRAYTLAKALSGTEQASLRLAEATLYVLVDGRSSADEFTATARELVDAGVDMIQLRDKALSDRQLLERARQLRQITWETKTLFVMNDRPDLAVLTRADGVHVGQDELSVKDARAIVGTRMLIGVSTHSIEQARAAVLAGASYIGCGPTFPSTTKAFDAFPGLDYLRQVAAEIRLPAFAIGGITDENLSAVLATGIRRVALRGQLLNSTDLRQNVSRLREMLVSE